MKSAKLIQAISLMNDLDEINCLNRDNLTYKNINDVIKFLKTEIDSGNYDNHALFCGSCYLFVLTENKTCQNCIFNSKDHMLHCIGEPTRNSSTHKLREKIIFQIKQNGIEWFKELLYIMVKLNQK